MKRICMLSATSLIFDARIQKEAKTLRDAGYKVSIIFIDDQVSVSHLKNPKEVWQNYLNSMKDIDNVRIFLASRTWVFLPRFLRMFCQSIEFFIKFTYHTLRQKADIYHCNDLFPALFSWFPKWLFGAKIVYDAHELEIFSYEGINPKWLKPYEKLMLRQSHLNITVNETIALQMEEMYGKKVEVIKNRTEFIAAAELKRNLLRQAVKAEENHRFIIYTGVLNTDRGIDKMVAAMPYLPDNIYFFIMGIGRVDEVKQAVAQQLKELNIDPSRVRILDAVAPDMVVHYASGADISILLYQSQDTDNNMTNMPNKLFQGVMARTPVLCSHNQSFPKFVYDNEVGIIGETVNESDSKAISEKVLYMLDETRQKMYRQHEDKLAHLTSWEAEGKKLVELYQTLN